MVHFSSVTARRIHSGLTPRSSTARLPAIGVPGYGWEAKIFSAPGAETPQGEIGELAVKGPAAEPVHLCPGVVEGRDAKKDVPPGLAVVVLLRLAGAGQGPVC